MHSSHGCTQVYCLSFKYYRSLNSQSSIILTTACQISIIALLNCTAFLSNIILHDSAILASSISLLNCITLLNRNNLHNTALLNSTVLPNRNDLHNTALLNSTIRSNRNNLNNVTLLNNTVLPKRNVLHNTYCSPEYGYSQYHHGCHRCTVCHHSGGDLRHHPAEPAPLLRLC